MFLLSSLYLILVHAPFCARNIQNSDGAKVMFVENDHVPLMVVKSDGGFGYDTTDLAAIKHR